jgi:hypothetical protein
MPARIKFGSSAIRDRLRVEILRLSRRIRHYGILQSWFVRFRAFTGLHE